jgi:hypothetical protein
MTRPDVHLPLAATDELLCIANDIKALAKRATQEIEVEGQNPTRYPYMELIILSTLVAGLIPLLMAGQNQNERAWFFGLFRGPLLVLPPDDTTWNP